MRFAQEISKSLEIPLGEYRSGIPLLRVVLCKEKQSTLLESTILRKAKTAKSCAVVWEDCDEDESLAKAVGYGVWGLRRGVRGCSLSVFLIAANLF